MRYIDIHNHVLYGLDDGAKSLEETLLMLKMAQQNNIKQLIVTPHYKQNVVENTKEIIKKRFYEVEELIRQNHLDIKIYLGSEIFLTRKTNDLLNNHLLQTLNDTQYILVETHRTSSFIVYDLKEELYNLAVDHYKVILAHPERYEFVHDNNNLIYDLVTDNHLMQVNVTSLDEKHPNHKLVRKLLDHQLVHFIASDAHDSKNRILELESGYQFVKEKYSETYANDLFYNNPLKVLNNETIDTSGAMRIKEKKWFHFNK